MRDLNVATLLEMANSNDAVVMDGTIETVRGLIADHDVVVAIWQDSTRPQGFGLMVIKGDHILREVVAGQAAFKGKLTAIKCIEAAQAMAMLMDSGERGALR